MLFIVSIICSCGNNASKKAEEEGHADDAVSNYRKPRTIEEACSVSDYATAHEILERLRYAVLTTSWAQQRENRAVYLSALETVYTSELTYIALNYPQDMDLRIMVRMNEMVPLGEKPDEGLIGYYETEDDGVLEQKGQEYNTYALWVKTYNSICNKLFDVAVITKNQHLAQSATSFAKENIKFTKGSDERVVKINGVKVDRAHGYVQLVKTDINALKGRYNDAVKSGLFK